VLNDAKPSTQRPGPLDRRRYAAETFRLETETEPSTPRFRSALETVICGDGSWPGWSRLDVGQTSQTTGDTRQRSSIDFCSASSSRRPSPAQLSFSLSFLSTRNRTRLPTRRRAVTEGPRDALCQSKSSQPPHDSEPYRNWLCDKSSRTNESGGVRGLQLTDV